MTTEVDVVCAHVAEINRECIKIQVFADWSVRVFRIVNSFGSTQEWCGLPGDGSGWMTFSGPCGSSVRFRFPRAPDPHFIDVEYLVIKIQRDAR